MLRLGTFGEDTNFKMMERPEVKERKTLHREITLQANFFKIDNNNDVMIHKYDVTFKPENCPKMVRFELFEKVKSTHFPDNHSIFYDGKSSVYSVNAISGYEREVNIFLFNKNVCNLSYEILTKRVFLSIINIYDLIFNQLKYYKMVMLIVKRKIFIIKIDLISL